MLTRSMTKRTHRNTFQSLQDKSESDGDTETEFDTDTDLESVFISDSEYSESDLESDSTCTEIPKLKMKSRKPSIDLETRKYLKTIDCEETKTKIITELSEINKINNTDVPLKIKILNTKLDTFEKARIIKIIERYENSSDSEGDFTKINTYINHIVDLPLGSFVNIKNDCDYKDYIIGIENKLNSIVFGHKNAKIEILQYICKMLSNPNGNGICLGIYGPAGIGKTTLVKEGIAKVLNRPFSLISLGGCSDSSTLDGHCFTYEGSKPGMIVDILQKAQCMNPVIYFDELDKISDTPKGDEIVNLLIHLTDSSQNNSFNDKYLGNGIKIDMSRAIFVFSFNDIEKINPILKDRIKMIKLTDFNVKEKINIARDFLIPNILNEYSNEIKSIISFTDETLEYIYNKYCKPNNTFSIEVDSGVRKFKELLSCIIGKINMISLVNFEPSILKLMNIDNKNFSINDKTFIDKLLNEKEIDQLSESIKMSMYL